MAAVTSAVLHHYADVAVDVIASFKKMRSLTTDQALVLKAIQSSSLVVVRFMHNTMSFGCLSLVQLEVQQCIAECMWRLMMALMNTCPFELCHVVVALALGCSHVRV